MQRRPSTARWRTFWRKVSYALACFLAFNISYLHAGFMGNRKRINLLCSTGFSLCGLSFFLLTPSGQAQSRPSAQTSQALVTEYCTDCHNPTMKTAGVVLDPAKLTNPAANAELWERAIKQLRAKSMPPVGNPRPDA